MSISNNSAILEEARSFIRSLDYSVSTALFQKKSTNSMFRYRLADTVEEILLSQEQTSRQCFESLDKRIQYMDGDEAELQKIWNAFQTALKKGESSRDIKKTYLSLLHAFKKDEALHEFKNTDLMIFPDGAVNLPLHGIRRKEIDEFRALYSNFTQKLKFDGNQLADLDLQEFQDQVFRDVAMILSRPLGRQLITRLLAGLDRFELIIKGDRTFQYSDKKNGSHEISYGLQSVALYQEMFGTTHTLSTFSFLNFAHELIHLLHSLDDAMNHPAPLSEAEKLVFTNPEEFRTIKGFCGCHPPDPICEESLRAQYSWIPAKRCAHLSLRPFETAEQKILKAVIVGANGDLEKYSDPETLGRNERISSSAMQAAVETLVRNGNFDGYVALTRSAHKNPQLQEGPFSVLKMREIPPALSSIDENKPSNSSKRSRESETSFSTEVPWEPRQKTLSELPSASEPPANEGERATESLPSSFPPIAASSSALPTLFSPQQ